MMRHGPHQGAQTSTRTGMVLRAIWRSKISAAISSGCPANTLVLHFPHLASMAGRDGGKRLIVPHLPQTTRFSVIGSAFDYYIAALVVCPRRSCHRGMRIKPRDVRALIAKHYRQR